MLVLNSGPGRQLLISAPDSGRILVLNSGPGRQLLISRSGLGQILVPNSGPEFRNSSSEFQTLAPGIADAPGTPKQQWL